MTQTKLPINIRDELSNLQQRAHAIQDAIFQLNRKFEGLADLIGDAGYMEQGTELAADEVEQLLQFNRHLSQLQRFLYTLENSLRTELNAKVADPAEVMADYECGIELNYTLRESDPEWSEDSDNFLAKRSIHCFKQGNDDLQPEDWRIVLPGLEAINAEPHCWLFHDLHDHCYGLDKPRVPLQDCLRLGEVWVDVVIRQQYWFDLDAGTWVKNNAVTL